MKRRWFIPAAVLAAMALALGACGGDDEEGGTAAGDGSITVFSLWGGSEQEAFQKVLDQVHGGHGDRDEVRVRQRLPPGDPHAARVRQPAGRRDHPAARRGGGARPGRRADPTRGHGSRPGCDQRELQRHVDESRHRRRHGLRRRREGEFEEHDLVQAEQLPEERLRDPDDLGRSPGPHTAVRVEGPGPVGGRRPGTRQLVDPDRLVREHLRPQGRLRQLHEAVQRRPPVQRPDGQGLAERRWSRSSTTSTSPAASTRPSASRSSTASAACSARTRSPTCTWRAASSAASRSAR